MRRRADDDVPPPGLLVFDGRGLSAAEWEAAYDDWFDARDQWEAEHLGVVLPEKRVLSGCPFDGMAVIGLPHAGGWSRLPHSDRTVCGAHNLAPDEH